MNRTQKALLVIEAIIRTELSNLLDQTQDGEMREEIRKVMTSTHNTISEILNMPKPEVKLSSVEQKEKYIEIINKEAEKGQIYINQTEKDIL